MQIESSIVRKLSGFYQNTFNKTADEWVDAIYAAKVPVGVINNLEQAFQEPQVIAREMLVEMNHPQREKLKVVGHQSNFREHRRVQNSTSAVG